MKFILLTTLIFLCLVLPALSRYVPPENHCYRRPIPSYIPPSCIHYNNLGHKYGNYGFGNPQIPPKQTGPPSFSKGPYYSFCEPYRPTSKPPSPKPIFPKPNPNVVIGPDNRVCGKHNFVFGAENRVKGVTNCVNGVCNCVKGRSNAVAGGNNSVHGRNNAICGHGNQVDWCLSYINYPFDLVLRRTNPPHSGSIFHFQPNTRFSPHRRIEDGPRSPRYRRYTPAEWIR